MTASFFQRQALAALAAFMTIMVTTTAQLSVSGFETTSRATQATSFETTSETTEDTAPATEAPVEATTETTSDGSGIGSGSSSTADHWPAGELNCAQGYRRFDPLLHKETYYVGVHAPGGAENAWREYNMTFESYLNEAVGQRFIPNIHFEMKVSEDPLQDWVDSGEEVDFMYSDTGLYSCIGVEIGGQPLGTTISHLTSRGRDYDVDMFAGSMVVRADNDRINDVVDLKDSVVGALSISDFAGAQVQFYVMHEAGLNYIMDPKQVIFVGNQEEIVRGVYDGSWDVGFVRTGMIERTKYAESDEYLDPDLFKVLEPKIYVMDNGNLFPFLHSTPVFPEWPFYARHDIDRIVSEEVQLALINFEYHKAVGDRMHSCKKEICDPEGFGLDLNNCTRDKWEICETAPPVFFDPNARCDTTRELAELAYQAGFAGRHNGFRPARSHFSLRTMQQTAGFLLQNEKGDWQCSRAATLYHGINCPEGTYKVNREMFEQQCSHLGLPCPEGMQCYCKPCIEAFEVDVLEWDSVEQQNRTEDESHEGCGKMTLCGEVKQTKDITFRVFDNREREAAEVTAKMHVRQESRELPVIKIANESYQYEFTFSDNELGVGILEVFVNGEQIPESPFRVQVVHRDCDEDFPGQGKEANDAGTCECGSGHVEIGSDCMETGIFAAIIACILAVIAAECAYLYISYRRAKSDEVWQVSVEELHFSQPVEVIGQGSFGVVLLAEYRGTKVAIKRVLPLKETKKGGSKNSSFDGNKSNEEASADIEAQIKESNPDEEPKKKGKSKSASKGTDSIDPYNSGSRSGSRLSSLMGGTSADDELDFLGGLSFGRSRSKWAKWFPWMFPDRESRYNASILGTASGTNGGTSTTTVIGRMCPWFDENARRQNEFMVEMRLLSRLRHPCITTVMGAVMTRGHEPMMVMEYMENGSLYDLLRNETLYTGGEIIMQIVRDVAQGLRFLHTSKPPILHGDLKAKNILIDSRFRAKVADFGLSTKKNGLSGTPFWMAPEYLRGKTDYNTTCDIYSFGIIMYEIYARQSPYEGEHPRQVLRKVCDPRVNKRPPVPPVCPPKMVDIMTKSWSPDPFFRPQAKDLDLLFMDMSPNDAEPIIPEDMKHKQATGDMLYDIFPRKVADKLKNGEKVEPETHENVTVFFSDIVHFTDISKMLSPTKVCEMLDRLYLAFDKLAGKHKVFKVETIGDAWMGVTNLENDQDDTHAKAIAEFAVDAVQAASQIMIDEDNPKKGYVRIRVGFHSGPVVSNVIGSLNPRFGLFGDTVNTASRMESNSYSQKIQCSEASAELLKEQAPDMPITRRGKVAVKGKGNMTCYWVGEGLLKIENDGSASKTYDDNPHQVTFAGDDGQSRPTTPVTPPAPAPAPAAEPTLKE